MVHYVCIVLQMFRIIYCCAIQSLPAKVGFQCLHCIILQIVQVQTQSGTSGASVYKCTILYTVVIPNTNYIKDVASSDVLIYHCYSLHTNTLEDVLLK